MCADNGIGYRGENYVSWVTAKVCLYAGLDPSGRMLCCPLRSRAPGTRVVLHVKPPEN